MLRVSILWTMSRSIIRTGFLFGMETRLERRSSGEQHVPAPPSSERKAHPLVGPFLIDRLTASAKHSARRDSSWREDGSRAAEFLEQMGRRGRN